MILFWRPLLGISFLFLYSVYMYFAMFTRAQWQIRATKSPRLNFISCTYKIIAFFAECCVGYFIKRRARKTPVLEWPINASNNKRSELRFCSKSNLCLAIKSMFSTQSCVCYLGSLKIHLFFLNKRWDKLWLKIAITRLSNTRFTCKIISALCIWHISLNFSHLLLSLSLGRRLKFRLLTYQSSSPSFLSVVTSPTSTKRSVA